MGVVSIEKAKKKESKGFVMKYCKTKREKTTSGVSLGGSDANRRTHSNKNGNKTT